MYEVCAQRNALVFFTTLPGCTGNINTNVGEHFISGKTTDLSGFGCDIRQWHDIEVVVKNKEARFHIDEKEVFSKHFTKSDGAVTGLTFSSNGLYEIDYVGLKGCIRTPTERCQSNATLIQQFFAYEPVFLMLTSWNERKRRLNFLIVGRINSFTSLAASFPGRLF
jgi:hypothetical protein